ncbi:MAG: galactokinase [Dehalococcoidia bacterium]
MEALVAAFEREFARRPAGIAEAPGRVNLIGEHVDYNDGLALPFAIDRSVLVAWAARLERERACFYSTSETPARVEIESLAEDAPRWDPTRSRDWGDYPEGVVWALLHADSVPARLPGIDLAIAGNVPQAAGLSSSAALEVAVAGALRDAFDLPVDDVRLAQLCQRAENEYVGVQCGIMDQFASTLSRAGHALLIDCRSLTYEDIPLLLDAAGLAAVVVHSGVPRALAASAYNDRRRECEAAVALLRDRLGRRITSLRDVTEDEIATALHAPDASRLSAKSERRPGSEAAALLFRRGRHVITEIARVRLAVEALRADDFETLGGLMAASHRSLRDDFEVSCPELDLLVDLAQAQPYVAGARLTGAGFGGCTISLVREDACDAFERDVVEAYRERTALPAVAYRTRPSDGLRTWKL